MKHSLLFRLLLLSLLFNGIAYAQSIPKEISVSGTAEMMLEPNTAVLTLKFQAQGQTASQAYAQSLNAREALLQSLNNTKFTSKFKTRGKRIYGPKNGPVTPGGIVFIEDIFSIEVPKISSVEKVVDLALNANYTILNIEFKVLDKASSTNELLLKATAEGQKKAALIASKLGVELGELLSAGVSEEPQGALILQARQIGVSKLNYDERPMKIFVSLRYGVKIK